MIMSLSILIATICLYLFCNHYLYFTIRYTSKLKGKYHAFWTVPKSNYNRHETNSIPLTYVYLYILTRRLLAGTGTSIKSGGDLFFALFVQYINKNLLTNGKKLQHHNADVDRNDIYFCFFSLFSKIGLLFLTWTCQINTRYVHCL